jgi:hypothetical protein
MLLNGAYWHEPVTENPTLDTVEIWGLINVTDDSHPFISTWCDSKSSIAARSMFLRI